MNVEFDRSFEKALRKLKDTNVKLRLKRVILTVDRAATLSDIPNLKKLTGYSSYYRIRLGDYRIGVELIATDTVRFITLAHRKDIYSIFP